MAVEQIGLNDGSRTTNIFFPSALLKSRNKKNKFRVQKLNHPCNNHSVIVIVGITIALLRARNTAAQIPFRLKNKHTNGAIACEIESLPILYCA